MATNPTLADQERDVKDMIRRGKGNPDKTGTLRRDTLRRLIDLTHSDHPSLKILAAGGIRHFFTDFPELEEDAINAVYDLCEDQSSKVRIEGYSAITQVSKAQTKWVKRNADVLLQLLQSDEPDEVIVVKKALTEHLDMDPRITLGVLCDQILPPEEPLDEEELSIRVRLRSLVLSFLAGEAKRAIVERHATSGSDAEDVLVNGLLAAIRKLGSADTGIIVKDLLLALPCYKSYSFRGRDLLLVLIEQAKESLRTDLQSGKPSTLPTTRPYLDLMALLVNDKRVAPSIELLRFYCTSLTGISTLRVMSLDAQIYVISNLAETLQTCEGDSKAPDGPQLPSIRRQLVDASAILLQPLARSGLSNPRPRNACKVLLQTCKRRKSESSWTVPPQLANSLRAILGSPGFEGLGEQVQDVQDLIRSLAPPTPIAKPQEDTNPPKGIPASVNIPNTTTQSNVQQRTAPVGINAPPRRMVIPSSKPRSEQNGQTTGPGSTTTPIVQSSMAGTATTSKHGINVDPSPRPPKKLRKDGEDTVAGPSLLSRMESSTVPVHRANTQTSTRTFTPAQTDTDLNDVPPSGGYTIKGAAAKTMSVVDLRTRASVREAREPPQASLLERIKGGESPSWGDDRISGGRKKKKRGKAQ